MFENLDYQSKEYLYRGLLQLVKSGEAVADQGHPRYALGSEGTYNEGMCGASPKTERMFQMMLELSRALHVATIDGSAEVDEWITDWQDYCRLIYSNRKR